MANRPDASTELIARYPTIRHRSGSRIDLIPKRPAGASRRGATSTPTQPAIARSARANTLVRAKNGPIRSSPTPTNDKPNTTPAATSETAKKTAPDSMPTKRYPRARQPSGWINGRNHRSARSRIRSQSQSDGSEDRRSSCSPVGGAGGGICGGGSWLTSPVSRPPGRSRSTTFESSEFMLHLAGSRRSASSSSFVPRLPTAATGPRPCRRR